MAKPNTQKSSINKSSLGKVNSTQDLKNLQKVFSTIIMRPLTADDDMMPDSKSNEMILPNDRLSAHERLELYARQYWWRIRDSIYEDFPGVHAVLGDKRFFDLIESYLSKHPSQSYTLRNLGRKFPEFIIKNPNLSKPYTKLCADVASLEWARTEAFDSKELKSVTNETFAVRDPGRVKISLQPHLNLLKLKYPANRFLAALKRREMEGEASNTLMKMKMRKVRRVLKPRLRETYIAVHRQNGKVFYKEIGAMEYNILNNLKTPISIEEALSRTKGITKIKPSEIQKYFQSWTSLKWICEGR